MFQNSFAAPSIVGKTRGFITYDNDNKTTQLQRKLQDIQVLFHPHKFSMYKMK